MTEAATLSPEEILKEAKFEPEHAKELIQHFQTFTQQKAIGDAGWHGLDDIKSLAGLEGSFIWMENILAPSQITLQFDAGHAGEKGTYKITSLQVTIEEGSFISIPNNRAIGWAFISLTPNLNPSSRTFTVTGMLTDQNLKIFILLLNKLGATGPVLPPFSAIRIS